jgi:ATP synthase subunit 6
MSILYSPFTQFEINVIQKILVPSLSISTFTIYLVIVAIIISFLYTQSLNFLKLVPTNLQIVLEKTYGFILSIVVEQTGSRGLKFFPILFVLFNFILISNLVGLMPFGFTITAHIALTLFLSLSFFIGWIIQGLQFLGFKFFNIFLPKNIPLWLLPLLCVIEILSFLIRPLSLSIRLFANMLAGHISLYILGSATLVLGIFSFLPFFFIIAFFILEAGIAFLQAYVFTILLAIYLADSFKAH